MYKFIYFVGEYIVYNSHVHCQCLITTPYLKKIQMVLNLAQLEFELDSQVRIKISTHGSLILHGFCI